MLEKKVEEKKPAAFEPTTSRLAGLVGKFGFLSLSVSHFSFPAADTRAKQSSEKKSNIYYLHSFMLPAAAL